MEFKRLKKATSAIQQVPKRLMRKLGLFDEDGDFDLEGFGFAESTLNSKLLLVILGIIVGVIIGIFIVKLFLFIIGISLGLFIGILLFKK